MKIAAVLSPLVDIPSNAVAGQKGGDKCFVVGFLGNDTAVCLFESGRLIEVKLRLIRVIDSEYLSFDESGKTQF